MFEDKTYEVDRLIIEEGYNWLEAWWSVWKPYLLPVVAGATVGILFYARKKHRETRK